MSFPPHRPPLAMPGMPPMIPPPYSMQHVVAGGMIPMAMGVMPPMMTHVTVAVPPSLPLLAAAPQQQQPMQRVGAKRPHTIDMRSNVIIEKKPLVHRSTPPVEEAAKGPPVTVFVGNITDRASDGLIRLILQKCGNVVNWKRVQGANGWLQAFGFCEYADPESAMRAIRILHDWEIGEKKLLVKVDAKTKEKLDEYKANKRGPTEGGNEGQKKASDDIDEAAWRQDRDTREAILHLLRSHSAELSRGPDAPPPQSPPRRQNAKQDTPEREKELRAASKLELDDMDIEEDKRNLITREIDKFRDTYKRQEEERDKDRERRRERKERRERTPDRPREREKERRPSSPRERLSERSERGDESSRRDRSDRGDRVDRGERGDRGDRGERNDRGGGDRGEERARSERTPSKARSESPERDWVREREREREREMREAIRPRGDPDRDWEREREEEEDAYERKKLERKLREKEAAYQERLRNWETRERRKEKEYEKERLKENEKRMEEAKEARRLKEFLEDYDDERDDMKYYKGNALQRRLKEREKEIELDSRDRQREREELEELRRKLAEEGHPDPEAEAKRIHHEEEARLLKPPPPIVRPEPRLDPRPDPRPEHRKEPSEPPEPEPRMESYPVESPPKRSYHGSRLHKMVPVDTPAERIREEPHPEHHSSKSGRSAAADEEEEGAQNSLSGFSDVTSVTPQEESKPLGFAGLKLGGSPAGAGSRSPHGRHGGGSQRRSGASRLPVAQAFEEEESATEGQRKKRKLVPLDDDGATGGGATTGGMSADEKRKHIKTIIDSIPTTKEDLFAYSFDRSLVDNALMERRIRPWINRKIIEYIGEEEPTLVDFICSKVLAGSAAQSILNDVSMVLDEEAEVFVVKMWRLLIYEVEAKKDGLVK